MILAVALSMQLTAQPHFSRYTGRRQTTLPYSAPWGAYRVIIEIDKSARPSDLNDGAPMRCRILDSKGRTLREMRDHYITEVYTRSITARGADDLVVETYSGGAYCCNTYYIFARSGHLRNILTFWGRHLAIDRIADLNGDGRADIELDSPILQRFSGWTFSRSYPIALVLSWNGTRLIDITARHPYRSRKQIETARKRVLEELKSGKEQKNDQWRWLTEGSISGYYANMMKIGQAKAGRQWLMKVLPASEQAWVRKYEGELRQLVHQSSQVRVSHRRVLQPKMLD